MFDIKDKLENIVDNVEGIAKNYYKLTVVNSVDKGSKIGAMIIVNIVILCLLFMSVLFAGFGLCYWIAKLLDNNIMLGFFIVAGGLLVLLILIVLLKGKVIQPFLRNIIIRIIYDRD